MLCEYPRERFNKFPWLDALYPTPTNSRFNSYPSLTPWTQLKIRALYRPCRALCLFCSDGLAIVKMFSSILILKSGSNFWLSSPLGPLILMLDPLTLTVTSSGIETGFKPTLEIIIY